MRYNDDNYHREQTIQSKMKVEATLSETRFKRLLLMVVIVAILLPCYKATLDEVGIRLRSLLHISCSALESPTSQT